MTSRPRVDDEDSAVEQLKWELDVIHKKQNYCHKIAQEPHC